MREGAVTSKLDSVVDREAQLQWLMQEHQEICNEARLDILQDTSQRERYREKYLALCHHKSYDRIIEIAAIYLKNCILSPRLTEKIFWNVSCLPKTFHKYHRRLLCFSMHKMETFVVLCGKKSPNIITFLINVSKLKLFSYYKNTDGMKKTFKNCSFPSSYYVVAGEDQITIETSSEDEIKSILTSKYVINAAKELNLRIMRKGKDTYQKYHCIQLANDIMQRLTNNP